ncbi:MAG: hypothetical protein AB9922_04560 [Bacteroidales bacterium]
MRLRLIYAFILLSGVVSATLIPAGKLYSQRSEKRFEFRGLIPQSRVVINYPAGKYLKKSRDTRVIFYALPNGNSIEQTEGANIRDSVVKAKEWRYDIQHIAAQVRFLRECDKRYNYVVVYLESETKAWTSHASAYPESPSLYSKLVDSVRFIVERELQGIAPLHKQRVIMASHSGGGRFVFNFIKGYDSIPPFVERFAFIDSNYGYETDLHSGKLLNWLKERPAERYLGVYAYVDTTVILDGKRIVSSKGGTGYRANLMAWDLKSAGLRLVERRDTAFVTYKGKGVEILIKENPLGKIYHTILVERNGLIHMLLSGSPLEERRYDFWGDRCYNQFVTDKALN